MSSVRGEIMSTDLLTQLTESGMVRADQIDAVRKRQGIYGGSIDTVVLELDLAHDSHNGSARPANTCVAGVTRTARVTDHGDSPFERVADGM